MKLLLDTHTLIWAGLAPAELSSSARALLTDEANRLFVSTATAWEIATKVRLGKLPGAERLEREFLDQVTGAGYELLPISAAVALRAGRLAGDHGDPFDRMIAAQALAEDMLVISKDTKLDAFGVRRLW
ncbi:type II toxin-antitoxin system VapC family toxin [Paracidobacterium acidisoli]|uniref:Type II toxin-antitoxin system VapC family toxin n=1 Tax=Paracidobacterium acidisoli TaxID=2303751 RepID=A0A372IPZ1_9BACT|nr:type II toxin-antitoxin system VapC family toxin [Paracidobacterium acidisoli]MBT9331138.1 type II toxin-antitoxin system VapC family toxin [Paracidobacterium acidisoli]